MNSIKILGVIAALAAGTSAFAQQAAPATSAGLLGQRYASAEFGVININHFALDQFGAGVGVNLPLTANLDLGLGYAHTWVESFSDIDSDILSADLTSYFSQGAIKPFGTIALGYDWNDFDDGAIWAVRAGFEYDVNPSFSTAISVGYSDDFESGDASQWDVDVRAHYWVTRSVAAIATVSLIEHGNVGYSLGVAVRF